MRVLQIHNAYQYRSGEEHVVEAEAEMLLKNGHIVDQWIVKNSKLSSLNALQKAQVAIKSIWSRDTFKDTRKLIRDVLPDVVHVHNTIPLISPSVYSACQVEDIPVVHTLHNYKLVCPGAYLYRKSSPCEDCVGKSIPLPAITHACYRGDRLQSTVAATGLAIHNFWGTYQKNITAYIALSYFSRQKFIDGGLPADRIAVKPNFLSVDPGMGTHEGQYMLYVGKLVKYKGVETLLKAWHQLDTDIPLKIAGQGPQEILLKSNLPEGIEYLGSLPRDQILQLMKRATCLIVPSEWYEPFGMVIIEAFATGLPVIASCFAGIPELVQEGITGWLFEPDNPSDLARAVKCAWLNASEVDKRGKLARQQFEKRFSEKSNYAMLTSIYETMLDWKQGEKLTDVFEWNKYGTQIIV